MITIVPHERLTIQRYINFVPEGVRSRVDYVCEVNNIKYVVGPLWSEQYEVTTEELNIADSMAIKAFEKKEKAA